MQIRILTVALAAVALAAFIFQGPLRANAEGRVVSTNPDMRIAKFRVLTTGTVGSTTTSEPEKDVFRASFEGIVFQDGDRLSFTFSGPDGRVDIGSPTFTGSNPSLTLANNKASGTLGASPYDWTKAKIKFNSRRNRLAFLSGPGRAQATPVLSTTPTSGATETNEAIDVIIHVRRTGESDSDFTFTGNFEVRHTVKRSSQIHTYKGTAR